MGANLHANGGLLLRDLSMPDFRDFALKVTAPGTESFESTRALGKLLGEVMRLNEGNKNFRVVGPDETASNRLDALYEATDKVFMEPLLKTDVNFSKTGRVLERLRGALSRAVS